MNLKTTREAKLTEILAGADITSESGEPIVDFQDRNSDSLDFANLSRSTIHRLMALAFEAGRAA